MSAIRFGSPTSASSAAHLVLSFSFFVRIWIRTDHFECFGLCGPMNESPLK